MSVDPKPQAEEERRKAAEERNNAAVEYCLRPVRGCATDEQYREAAHRIVVILGYRDVDLERLWHFAGCPASTRAQ